jgi:hypothetical protein
MAIDILEALEQQKIDAYAPQARIICEDGLLSISDEVFKCAMYHLGLDKAECKEWLLEPVDIRHKLIERWYEPSTSKD